jgi:hypothetical protein
MVNATDKIILFCAEDEHLHARALEQDLNKEGITPLLVLLPMQDLPSAVTSAYKTIFVISAKLKGIDEAKEAMLKAWAQGGFLPVIFDESMQMPSVLADIAYANLSETNPRRYEAFLSLVKALKT